LSTAAPSSFYKIQDEDVPIRKNHISIKTIATLSRLLDQLSLDPGGVHINLAMHLKALQSHCHGVSSPAALMLCLKGEADKTKKPYQ